MIRFPSILTLATVVFVVAEMRAQDEAEEVPVTMSRALKLGVEGLATDPSEAGQDRAAELYAVAKRLQTENGLAQKNLELVVTLDGWRDVLSKCRRGSCDLVYIVNGGGTMYSHGAARDVAEVEDFLAGLAKNLPLAEGKGSAKANAHIDEAIVFLKTLKPSESGDADADKEATTNLNAERDRVVEHWESLKYMVGEIPSRQAEKIAAFASDSLSWLKEQ